MISPPPRGTRIGSLTTAEYAGRHLRGRDSDRRVEDAVSTPEAPARSTLGLVSRSTDALAAFTGAMFIGGSNFVAGLDRVRWRSFALLGVGALCASESVVVSKLVGRSTRRRRFVGMTAGAVVLSPAAGAAAFRESAATTPTAYAADPHEPVTFVQDAAAAAS